MQLVVSAMSCALQRIIETKPTVQEFEFADYFFHRTFDVGHFTISDLTSDKVAGLEVKRVFNRTVNSKNTGIISDEKEEGEISAFVDTLEISTSLSGGSAYVEFKNPNLSVDKVEVKDEVKVAKCSNTLNSEGKDSNILEKSPCFTGNKRKSGVTKDFWGYDKVVKAAKETYAIQDTTFKKPWIDNSITNCKNEKKSSKFECECWQ